MIHDNMYSGQVGIHIIPEFAHLKYRPLFRDSLLYVIGPLYTKYNVTVTWNCRQSLKQMIENRY